ncbi:MAG: hypothetical protein QXI19_10270 [Candidatus Caldarchaeum sp.]
MPEPKDLHIDSVLSEFSAKYKNDAFIWRAVMPEVRVRRRSDKFVVYRKEDSYRLYDDSVGPKAMPNEVDWGVSFETYSVRDHALGEWLPQETIDNADNPLAPEVDTNEFLNMLLDVAQEKRVAGIVFNASTYPNSNKVTLSGTSQWGQSADDPIGDLLKAIEGTFIRANTLVFGQEAWQVFRKLPEVLDAVKGATRQQSTPGGLATTSEIAGLLEVDRVLVGRARYISSKEGQSATYTKLWGKHCAALYVEPTPGIRTITFGVTFVETPRQTMRDFDPKRGVKGAHYIKVSWNSDEKVIAPDLGYLIENAVP